MALILILGINGVGKDTLALEMRKRYGEQVGIVLSTRVLFKALGYRVNYVYGESSDSYDLSQMYKALEETPKSRVDQMMNYDFHQALIEFKPKYPIGLLSAHLVASRRDSSGQIYFETGFTYPWYSDFFDGFVYLRAKPGEVLRRREDDKKRGVRDRGYMSLEEIGLQLEASDNEWLRFESSLPNGKPRIVINNDSDLGYALNLFDSFVVGLNSQTFS